MRRGLRRWQTAWRTRSGCTRSGCARISGPRSRSASLTGMTSEPAVQPMNAERDHAAAMYAYASLGDLLSLPLGLERMAPEDVMRILLEQTYRGIHVCAVMAA